MLVLADQVIGPLPLNFVPIFSFIPHGHCYLWKPSLVSLHLVSDSLITIAYYCIPFFLIDIARKRQDLPFRNTFVLFSAFIIACGTTHLLEVWTLWHPDYWVSGMMKAVTALISIYTAASLFALTPKILGLPSPELLEIANEALATKVIEHQQAEAKIQGLNQELESRIAERTQALEQTNYELSETNKRLRDTMKELLSAELALIHQKESFQRVLEHIPDIIARFDRHLRHVYVNGAVEKETGIPPQDFIGKTNQEMGMPEDLVQQWENVMLEVFMTQESQSMEFEYDSPHGLQTFQTYLVPEYSSEDAVEYVLALTRNVTVAKALESQLRLAAERDGLTQIPNRRSFDRYLETKWDKAQAQGQTISVLICDVDYFKAYNDCYGHLKGDDILCTVAHTIEQALDYPPYLAARYGGEEFAVVLPWASPRQALNMGEKIRQAIVSLHIPHQESKSGHPFLTISVGAASLIPQPQQTPKDLLEMADQALYQAKHQGRNQVVMAP